MPREAKLPPRVGATALRGKPKHSLKAERRLKMVESAEKERINSEIESFTKQLCVCVCVCVYEKSELDTSITSLFTSYCLFLWSSDVQSRLTCQRWSWKRTYAGVTQTVVTAAGRRR